MPFYPTLSLTFTLPPELFPAYRASNHTLCNLAAIGSLEGEISSPSQTGRAIDLLRNPNMGIKRLCRKQGPEGWFQTCQAGLKLAEPSSSEAAQSGHQKAL